jgi:hypothetical protein
MEGHAMKTPEEQTDATTEPADAPTNGVPRTPPAPSKPLLPMTEDEYNRKNERRHALIDKEFDGGLTAAEEQELALLEKVTSQYLDAAFPLPFEIIEKMKELARKDGISLDDFPK